MRARLTVQAGAAMPPIFDVTDDAPVRLGRHRDNTIILHDVHASREHAELVLESGRWFLKNVSKTNGTRVNGRKILDPVGLSHGDEIVIGDVRIVFTVPPSDKAVTAEIPVPPDELLSRSNGLPETSTTLFQHDDLTALFNFLTGALLETTPGGLIDLALNSIHRQTRAAFVGFLDFDPEQPQTKSIVPALAKVDVHLSRQLTQKAVKEGRSVWVASPMATENFETESLVSFRDALCVPLRASEPGREPSTPLGALHVYRSNRSFTDREVKFCEVLAGCLGTSLHLLRVRRVLEADVSRLRIIQGGGGDDLVGVSAAMEKLRQQIRRAAVAPCTVLIHGESGVGKELVALALHRYSPRHEEPFVPVNTAAVSASLAEAEFFGHKAGSFTNAAQDRQGYFQQADGGTLFLDEIGEMPAELQAMLLRVLENKKVRPVGGTAEVQVDVRVVVATNRDLQKEVRENRFRQDLLFRLNTLTLEVPPLRDHAEDIPSLCEHFLTRATSEYRRKFTLSDAALDRLQAYHWPGNVRQLQSVIMRAVAMAETDTIHAGDLHLTDMETGGGPPMSLNLEELEAWAIRQALEQTKGNNTHAAKLLGIHRDTLITKQKKYGIERKA